MLSLNLDEGVPERAAREETEGPRGRRAGKQRAPPRSRHQSPGFSSGLLSCLYHFSPFILHSRGISFLMLFPSVLLSIPLFRFLRFFRLSPSKSPPTPLSLSLRAEPLNFRARTHACVCVCVFAAFVPNRMDRRGSEYLMKP